MCNSAISFKYVHQTEVSALGHRGYGDNPFPRDAIVFFLYLYSLLRDLHLNSAAYSKSTS